MYAVHTHQARGIHSPGTWYTLTRHVVQKVWLWNSPLSHSSVMVCIEGSDTPNSTRSDTHNPAAVSVPGALLGENLGLRLT